MSFGKFVRYFGKQMQITKKSAKFLMIQHRDYLDMAKDLNRTLEQAVELGFTTILTSGGKASAPRGAEILAALNHQAAGRIRLMAGAGVNAGNIPELFAAYNMTASHGMAKAKAAYAELSTKADACRACHHCEKECPQHIHISEIMPKVAKIFE